jgi:hypothetical protein
VRCVSVPFLGQTHISRFWHKANLTCCGSFPNKATEHPYPAPPLADRHTALRSRKGPHTVLSLQRLLLATPRRTLTPCIGRRGSDLISHRLPLRLVFQPSQSVAAGYVHAFRQITSKHGEVMLVKQGARCLDAISGLLVSADSEWKDGHEDARGDEYRQSGIEIPLRRPVNVLDPEDGS